jgi:hypothetical protein
MEVWPVLLRQVLQSTLERPFTIKIEAARKQQAIIEVKDGVFCDEMGRKWTLVAGVVDHMKTRFSKNKVDKIELKAGRETYTLYSQHGAKAHALQNILAGKKPRNIRARNLDAEKKRGGTRFKAPDSSSSAAQPEPLRVGKPAQTPVPGGTRFRAPNPPSSDTQPEPPQVGVPAQTPVPSYKGALHGLHGLYDLIGGFRRPGAPPLPAMPPSPAVPPLPVVTPAPGVTPLRPEGNLLVNEKNEVISFAQSASGAIFIKRPFNRKDKKSKEVVLKVYPRHTEGRNAMDAAGGSLEYYIY